MAKSKKANVVPVSAGQKDARENNSIVGRLSLLLAIICFIVYVNTLKNGFVMDDSVMIVNNSIVAKGISGIPELLVTPHQHGFWHADNDEYRPLPLVVHAVIYQFAGLNPVPYHLVNILFFIVCVVLLFRFLDALLVNRTGVAFMAALFFALHPIHTEVVANIKSSDEMLCFIFSFLALDRFMKYTTGGKVIQLLTGFLFMVLAYISKETVVTFLAVVPLVVFFFKDSDRKRAVYVTGCVVLATVIFVFVRYSVLNYYHANTETRINIIENALAKEGLPAESKLATAVLILGRYLKQLVVPYPLVSEYSFNSIPYTHFSDPMVLLSLLVYVGMAAVAIARFLKNKKDPYALGIFFFLITLSLFSNLIIMVKSTMGERFLFFPSVGFCLVAALLVERLSRQKGAQGGMFFKEPRIMGLLIVAGVVYSVIIIERNGEWADNYTLFSADVKKTPENSHMNYLLGYKLFSMAREERNPAEQANLMSDAIGYMRKSASILPEYYYAAADLGAAYFNVKRYDSAEYYDRKALMIRPKDMTTRNNLTGVLNVTKQYRQNVQHCKETLMLVTDTPYPYADLGASYINMGKPDSALYYLRTGISRFPDFYGCYDVLAYVHHAMGNEDSAVHYQSLAKQLANR